MTRRPALALFATVLVVVLGSVVAGGVAGAQGAATLDPVSGVVKAGDVVAVTGTGWPAGQMVSASICGRGGANGSAYCNLQSASVFPITRDGVLIGRATVAIPPDPCPCVLQVFVAGAGTVRATPIQIEGAPYAELPPGASVPTSSADPSGERTPAAPDPTLHIDAATIEDTSSWTAIFGAASSRVLHLTVTNTGVLPVRNPFLSVHYGKDGGPSFVVDAPQIEIIAAGETVTADVPFELGALSFGDYNVAGDIGVVGNRVGFSGSTSTWPWGLLVVGIVLLQLLVLWIVRRNRRRRRAREAELAAAGVPPEDPTPVAAEPVTSHAASTPGEPVSVGEPADAHEEPAPVESAPVAVGAPAPVAVAGAAEVAAGATEADGPAPPAAESDPSAEPDAQPEPRPEPARPQDPMSSRRRRLRPQSPTRLTGPVTAAPWT